MSRKINKKGFTLIELLAVIVILGVVMAIAIPSMTTYIENSRKDTMLSTAQQFVNAARDMLVSDNELPSVGSAIIVPIEDIELEKGGTSPYTNSNFNSANGASYVIAYNSATSSADVTSSSYVYAIALDDGSKSCLSLVSERYLTSQTTKNKRDLIKNSGGCGNTAGLVPSSSSTFTVQTVSGESFPNTVSFNSSNLTIYSN